MSMDLSLLVRNVLWNGMLAVIPVALAQIVFWLSNMRGSKPIRNILITLLSLVWLAFLPNTCYLLTEWRHFLFWVDVRDPFVSPRLGGPLLEKIVAMSVFYLLYSGFGMLTFALAIRPMKYLACRRGAAVRFWAVPFFIALSIGVYLGLVLRFNTWDLISRPRLVWSALVDLGSRARLLTFIFAFGLFLWAAYEAMDIWIDGLRDRWDHITGKGQRVRPDRESKTTKTST